MGLKFVTVVCTGFREHPNKNAFLYIQNAYLASSNIRVEERKSQESRSKFLKNNDFGPHQSIWVPEDSTTLWIEGLGTR